MNEYITRTSVNLATYMIMNGVDVEFINVDGKISYRWLKNDDTYAIYQQYKNDKYLQEYIRLFKEVKLQSIVMKGENK